MVNTFVLYFGTDFKKTSNELDSKRRFKQLVEARQIINTIETNAKAWSNHPCTLSWKNNLNALKYYYNCFYDSLQNFDLKNFSKYEIKGAIVFPWFLFFEPFVYSNRAMLYKKMPNHYTRDKYYFPESYMPVGYFWPVKIKRDNNIEYFEKNKENPQLICDVLDKKYNGNYCKALLKTGVNKGKECGILGCKRHQ